jgi:hypothetical protein
MCSGGWGKVVWPSVTSHHWELISGPAYCMQYIRLLYVDMGDTAHYGIRDSKFRKILETTFPNAARPSSFADGQGICGSAYKIDWFQPA